MTALDKLIEAVEAGTADKDDHYAAFPTAMKGEHYHAWSAYNGSLEAALSLHEALLPEWAADRMSWWPGGEFYVLLLGTHEEDGTPWHGSEDGRVEASSTVPARAWLLAILRAYRSVQS